jgi:hypothetical protein
MRDFYTWLKETHNLDERGIRTALGIYPPQYGRGQYPDAYFYPISATAPLSLQNAKQNNEYIEKPKKKKLKNKSKKKPKK